MCQGQIWAQGQSKAQDIWQAGSHQHQIASFCSLMPVGIASLIAACLAGIENLQEAFLGLGFLILIVAGALIFQQLIVLPLIVLVVARKNPLRVFPKLLKPWLVAMASQSS